MKRRAEMIRLGVLHGNDMVLLRWGNRRWMVAKANAFDSDGRMISYCNTIDSDGRRVRGNYYYRSFKEAEQAALRYALMGDDP